MSLPLLIFDDDADLRQDRLSTVSPISSLHHEHVSNEDCEGYEIPRSQSRGRSRSRAQRRASLPPPPPAVTHAPPIPPKSAARRLTSTGTTAKSVSSVYSHSSQWRKYPIGRTGTPDWDEKGLIEVHEVLHSLEMGRLSDPRPAPLPPWHPNNNPDGGTQAWLSAAGSWCGVFVSFGWISSIGVFQAYYQTHQLQHMSPAAISWICSLETFMVLAGVPVFGRAFDNYGVQPLLITGSFLHVLGLMLASVSSHYYQFVLSQGILSSLGASMIFYPSMANIDTWFTKRKALAVGILAFGASVGGIVFPVMFDCLSPHVGFGWSMRAVSLLILALCVVANFTVTSRNKPMKRSVLLQEYMTPLSQLSYTLTCAGCFLFFMGLFLPINFIVLQAGASRMSPHLAAYMPAIINGFSFFGRVGPPWAAEFLGRFNVTVAIAFFCAVVDLALWIPSRSNALIILYCVLYGVGAGAFISMGTALVAQIVPETNKIGIWTGTYFGIVSCAALIGTPLGGAIVDQWHGDFLGLQIFTGCLHVGAVLLLALARISLSGFAWRVKL